LSVLYERHHGPVYRFVRRLGGSIEMAEDVTHDSFLVLLERAERFDPRRGSLRTYLCTIARSRAYDRLRREGRELVLDDGYDEAAPAPIDPVVCAERSVAVAQAVARLPPLQREALVLFEYEEMDLAEIAQVTGAEVGTIKSRLHRAREALRRSLAGFLERTNDVRAR
jgi:RNA polymerase sigma-70 factor, ECF subfamily